MERPYYVTTPIYYISGKPHIGHAYTTIVADVLARTARTFRPDVLPDRNGRARTKGRQRRRGRRQDAAGMVRRARAALEGALRRLPRGVRRLHPHHASRATIEKVARVFERLRESGDVYLGKYEGWYCVDDETFWLESKLVDGRCPTCGREVQWISEEDWFFRLSAYRDRLIEHFERQPAVGAAAQRLQRDDGAPRRGPRRSLDLAHELRLGRPDCRAAA